MTKSAQPMAQRIARAIEQRIIDNVHQEATSLRQADLAAEFGTSHIPVREALVSLAAKGMVQIIPNRGAVVVPMSGSQCDELAAIRAALEPLALRRALPRLGEWQLKEARAALRQGRQATRVNTRARFNWDFHRALYAAADQPLLLSQLDTLWRHAERYLVFAWKHANYEARSDDEHERIYEACATGNLRLACRLTRQHILAAAGTASRLLARDRDSRPVA
jgi:DNA-binding GntR family transcriptional regulator